MSHPWLSQDRFYVSPHNYAAGAVDRFVVKPGGSTSLFDSTLRKIMLVPGLRPRLDDMLEIAGALDDLGIQRVTMNLHWWGEDRPEGAEWEVSSALLTSGFRFTTVIVLDNWTLPHWQRDMERMRELGLVEPILSLGTRLLDKSSEEHARARDRLADMIGFCNGLGMRPGVSFRDVGRVDLDALAEVANLALGAGAARLSLADSASSLGPDGMRFFLSELRRKLSRPAQMLVHTHDDFGLGTATAIAAVTAGAEVEVSVNGISDRAGFPALEEVAVALESMYGISTGLRMDRIADLCALVGARTLRPHPFKAIGGDHAFLIDLPYAFGKALQDGLNAFPPPWGCISPPWVGATARLYWLRQFLAAPILRQKLASLDLPADDDGVRRVQEALRAKLEARTEYPIWLDQTEVDAICRTVLKGTEAQGTGSSG